MVTIVQLASYAGVTIAAVRHYHKVGLLPEPERNSSGYRTYGAAAVVRLIRIRVLASAGVPLALIDQLLDADPDAFAAAVRQIDLRLRAEARQIQAVRKRLGMLAGGERLALPESVVGYLDRLRSLGSDESYIERVRDAWIVVAAQVPSQIDEVIASKHRDLDDPDIVRLYTIFGEASTLSPDDPRVVEAADILDRVLSRTAETGLPDTDALDPAFLELMDAAMAEAGPVATRLLELLAERGWRGWTRFERASTQLSL